MKYSLLFATFLISAYLSFALPDPVYTIHYVRSYRQDLVQQNLGCGKSIAYGTYVYPMGPIDAFYGILNPHQFGFSVSCSRPATYVKIFGDAQNYSKIMNVNIQMMTIISQNLDRIRAQTIIQWKYLPEGQDQRQLAFNALKQIYDKLADKGHKAFIKAPASFFCADTNGKKFILDQPAQKFIVELYGEEPGKYTTYESIFGESAQAGGKGYTKDCPKYPTKPILNKLALGRHFYFEKTLDSTEPGFIGPKWQIFLQRSGHTNQIYFYDGYPAQKVDL